MIRRKEKGILLTMVLTIAFFVMGMEMNTARAGNLALSAEAALIAAHRAGVSQTWLSVALLGEGLPAVYSGYNMLKEARQYAADAYTYASYASGSGNAGTYAYYAHIYANDALNWIEEAETYALQAYTQDSVDYCLLAINRAGFGIMYICTAIYNAGIGSVGGQY